MSSPATSLVTELSSKERLEVLFGEMEELAGQRNAIDSRLVEIAAEIDGDGIWGATGARSVPALVAWKLGTSPHNAKTIVTVARRLGEFPRLAAMMRDGQLSLNQIGVIAERAGEGSDEHYAQLASVATVTQLRFAIKLEPRPDPDPKPDEERSISKTVGETHTTWRIRLPKVEAAKFEAGLASHRDALVAAWRRDHDTGDADGDTDGDTADTADDVGDVYGGARHGENPESPEGPSVQVPPFPHTVDAFMSLVEAGWDADVARRPHGQHTAVVVHLDVESRNAALHLGSFLSEDERRLLTCEADCEIWFERHGQVIGSGRATRQISRRLRRALEHRDRCCVVPGCAATRGLHAHHIRHWEDGGPTELDNLVLLCPFHHRLHHSGGITITGPAAQLVVSDADGEPLRIGSLARTPTQPPPPVKPCRGPLGERAEWWWYTPFEPKPPPSTN
jgi:hypothetical protein